MRTTLFRPVQQRSGGPVLTLEKIVGIDKKITGASGQGSDFAGVTGVTGTYTIATLQPGDVVFPSAIIDVLTPFVVAAATLTASLGVTGTPAQFIAATDIKSATAKVLVGTTAGQAQPYVNNTASPILLILTLTAATGNISDITAGELRIKVPISRRAERLDQQG